ncbi:MAG: U32 family peptidase [Clostridia bacterium]|nr:U32 family peptidase [Clostridia bacterium]
MEILAPAGSFEALRAAVENGADAVYVGGNRYSARKSAQNFTDEELATAVDYCHLRNSRLYLCCNTLLKETELDEAMAFIRYAYAIGVDALIMQDWGLVRRVRQELPEFPVHASTQMTVTNSDGIAMLERIGASRVVLAREVTAKEIAAIREKTQMELEYFVHGALCISYSGQCLMSSILGGRSGNRGGCAQPCRLPYTLLKNGQPVTETLPLLCPKDLCLADRVQELKNLGVTSLKIEGRMKSPEYVAMVTRIYKQATEGTVSADDIRSMLKFFSRGGSCYGYFDGCTYGNMMDMADGTKIAGALPEIEKKQKTLPVTMQLVARTEEPLYLRVENGEGISVSVTGELCQKARTRATEKSRMEEQLRKLGGTAFYAKEVSVEASDDVAVAIKDLNALRRSALEQLEQKIVNCFHREPVAAPVQEEKKTYCKTETPVLCAEVNTKEQLKAAVDMGIERIYMPASLLADAKEVKDPVVLLPPINKELQTVEIGEKEGVCIQNIGQLAKMQGREITAGHRLNITNSQSIAMLQEMGVTRFVLSPELNMKAISSLRRHTDTFLEVIGYGRLPLMLLENCIIKSAYGCVCDEGEFALKDRKNEVFPIGSRHCGNIIYNSKPLYMADRILDIKNLQINGIRLCFSLENYETCCIIIREYQEALSGKKKEAPEGGFTRGHFYRGMQ